MLEVVKFDNYTTDTTDIILGHPVLHLDWSSMLLRRLVGLIPRCFPLEELQTESELWRLIVKNRTYQGL